MHFSWKIESQKTTTTDIFSQAQPDNFVYVFDVLTSFGKKNLVAANKQLQKVKEFFLAVSMRNNKKNKKH